MVLTYELANAQADPVQFFVFPCFGEVSLFASAGTIPTPDTAGCSVEFMELAPFLFCGFGPTTMPTNYSILLVGEEDFRDRTPPQSSMFDLIATNQAFDQVDRLPVPANAGQLEVGLNGDGSRATITFTPTGIPGDLYSLWRIDGDVPDGAVLQTGCGVQVSRIIKTYLFLLYKTILLN